jgi:UDP-N-acetyl-2-amino-2-deoxyglucuronate dehydrogenase
MRFAVIGAGVIGTLHAETMAHLPGAELTAVVDVRPEPARSLALTDLNEALGRPEVDAVAICTPSGHHADLVEAALAAGKHVVVEKPLDVSPEAAFRVAAAEQTSRRCVTVISQHRFDRASQIVFEAVRSGRLGNVTSGSAIVSWWRWRIREVRTAARWLLDGLPGAPATGPACPSPRCGPPPPLPRDRA